MLMSGIILEKSLLFPSIVNGFVDQASKEGYTDPRFTIRKRSELQEVTSY